MTQNCLQIVDWLKSWFKPLDEEYHYIIEASDYNPTIDSTITITVTVENGSYSPVSNHTFSLLLPDGTYQSLTTSQGIAQYTYTCSDWGLKTFSVIDTSIQVNVTGWKTVESLASNKITVKRNEDMVSVQVNGSWSLTSATSNVLATVNSAYRPSTAVNCLGINTSNANRLYVWTNGNVSLYSLASQTGSTPIEATLTYPI